MRTAYILAYALAFCFTLHSSIALCEAEVNADSDLTEEEAEPYLNLIYKIEIERDGNCFWPCPKYKATIQFHHAQYFCERECPNPGKFEADFDPKIFEELQSNLRKLEYWKIKSPDKSIAADGGLTRIVFTTVWGDIRGYQYSAEKPKLAR